MKYKGKVVQIIKEEESDKMVGTYKIPNHDWLNIVDKELYDYQESKKFKNYKIIFWSSIAVLILFVSLSIFLKIKWLIIPVVFLFVLILYVGTKDLPKDYHYLIINKLIPINKPYNFKLNDEIEIEINLKRIK